ncbi:MAG: transketolase [Oscillospiraceae bacterium]|nr:transketolase [Oscillospiraceae bacterium]MCI9526852.1 transketolase [Lachnospiraceae bacterium]
MEMKEEKIQRLRILSNKIRKDILELTFHAGKNGAHIGGAFSSAEILAVLYGEILKVSPELPYGPERDRFILSKGHTAVGLYAALFEKGFLTQSDFESFEKNGGILPAHCVENQEKGIELSSGSLGMGLSFGVGCALSGKRTQASYRVFVLMGNGECNEGCVWESVMLAAQQGLDHLVAIIDCNKMQLDGNSQQIIDLFNLDQIFLSFGWNMFRLNGNKVEELLNVLENIPKNGKPTVLIADTVKGKGCSFMEGIAEFHHAVITQEQYDLAIKELENNGI